MACFCESLSDPEKELLRLRINWIFVVMSFSLVAVSYTSISPSFHEFITDPTVSSLSQVEQSLEQVEPGLGKSEVFYSWVIAVNVVGSFTGSLVTGFAIQVVPYWYIMLFGLSTHTLGYLVYTFANSAWLIMLSKFLSGVYIGLAVTFALAYFSESSLDYQAAHKALGNDEVKAPVVRNRLFALYQLGIGVGYVLGPGAAVIFAQFDIDQIRSVAWFNTVGGVALIALQVALFRGESSFVKSGKRCWQFNQVLPKMKISCLDVFILVFMICCAAILGFKFGVFKVTYNAVLSDYFGFTDIENSYFSLGLALPRICGSIILLILLQFRLKNSIVAIIGLLLTFAGAALMADWQSIPSDPCTQLSPFHHPELAVNYSSAVNDSTPRPPTYTDYDLITVANTDPVNFDCYKQQNCITVYENVTHSQEFQIFPDAIYAIAMNKCESATIPNHHCYWIPNSIVTNRHCGDCPLICRDKKRSLNFVQFLLGATLLMGSTPFCRVPILGFISDRVPRKIQGLMIGIAVAFRTVASSISLLWLDAAYEMLQKRTVLAMGLLMLVYIPFLVGILLMYRQLENPPSLNTAANNTSDSESSESSDSDDIGAVERKQLVPI